MSGFNAEVISDTHLNLWKNKGDPTSTIFSMKTPNLILAGDIGDPDDDTLYKALDLARQKYKRVIYVPGNHEFYKRVSGSKKTPASTLAWFRKLDDQWDNFHFFYRRTEVYDGVRILGATGWSTAPSGTEWAKTIGEEGRKDREFLEKGLSLSKEPILAITHYPSTLRVLQPDFQNKITQYNYAQNLEYLYQPPLHTWIFGHVHQSHDIHIPYSSSLRGEGNIRILCAPYGYPGEQIASQYTKTFTVPASLSSAESPRDTFYQRMSNFI